MTLPKPSHLPWLWLGAGLLLGWASSSWARWARQQLLQWLWPIGPLQLQRPLVAFDIEATGLNVSKDRILEIAAVKLLPSGRVEVKGPQRLNPGVAIPAEVTAIHNIAKGDVQGCPTFGDVAADWRDFLEGCDLLGYNAKKFDVPILRNEFRRCGQFNFPPLGVPVVDAFRIFCNQEPRTLSAAVSFYTGRPHGKEAAHSALGDAWATLRVLVEQVRRYPGLPRSAAALAALCAKPGRAQDITPDSKFQWRGDQPVVGFGKYQGEPLAVLIARHKDHLMWMSGQDWGDESLIVVAQALKGLLPTRQGGWEPLFDTPPPDMANGSSSSSSSSRPGDAANGRGSRPPPREQQQQQQQEQQQEQPAEQQQQQEQHQPPTPGGAAAGSNNGAHGSAGSSSVEQHPEQAATPPTPEAASPAVTGWPDLTADTSPAATHADSWGCDPASAAAPAPMAGGGDDDEPGAAAGGGGDGEAAADAAAAQEWEDGAAAGGVDAAADGWSGLETVRYPGDPEPQAPADEEEGGEVQGRGAAAAAEQQQQRWCSTATVV